MGQFEDVKEATSLKAYANSHLRKSGGGMWCCPACGSGTRGTADSDGALSIYDNDTKWKCFSCHAGGDIFDLAAAVNGLDHDDRRAQLQAVADWAHIPTGEATDKPRGLKALNVDWDKVPLPGEAQEANKGEAQEPDYTEGRAAEAAKVMQWRAELWKHEEAISYLTGRGFTRDEIKRLGFGYDAQRKRVIVPWKGAPWYHTDRDITGKAEHKYLKPSKENVGPQPLYNPDAAREPVFFVLEGGIDALAVELEGYPAIALGSNNISERNADELAQAVLSIGGDGIAVLFDDNDERGLEGFNHVAEAFDAAGIPYAWANYHGSTPRPKDAAEWLQVDRAGLAQFLKDAEATALRDADAARERQYREALANLHVYEPAHVANGIYSLAGAVEPIPTGIRELDSVLGGGLLPGLYGIGAISSFGKTTVTLQIADTVAASGRGVLFVTIEQSARELVSKSLSRLASTEAGATLTAQEMTNPKRRAMWGQAQEVSFLTALEAYNARIAPRLRILEGVKQPSVKDIRAIVATMAKHDGVPPCVFIDYLQLLAAPGERDTDKQAIDKNVMALRQMARDYKTPVWVVSSLNRASYAEGVTMEAFKESGSVEYGSDVLLGLQPRGMADKLDGTSTNKQKREAAKILRESKDAFSRECELVILKNRNGRTPKDGIPLTFKPLSCIFIEDDAEAVERKTARTL